MTFYTYSKVRTLKIINLTFFHSWLYLSHFHNPRGPVGAGQADERVRAADLVPRRRGYGWFPSRWGGL